MSGSGADVDLLRQQVEEVEAMQACYPDALQLAESEAAALRLAERVASGDSAATAEHVPALSGALQLPDILLAGHPVVLRFTLPKQGGLPARLQVFSSGSRHDADRLQALAASTAAECAEDGTPCLLIAADQLMQAAQELAAAEATVRQQAAADQEQQQQQQAGGRELVLSRRTIWSHHIKSLTKRKHILEWGKELNLGGFSKPGYPGVILVEGVGADVDEYWARLRRLQWKALAVRGQEDWPCASLQELEVARRLPRGVTELGEDEMGRAAAISREAGLEELFLTALKLSPRSDGC